MPSESVPLIFSEFIILLFGALSPDFIREYANFPARTYAYELLGAIDLPDNLSFLKVIEENGRVPACFRTYYTVSHILL